MSGKTTPSKTTTQLVQVLIQDLSFQHIIATACSKAYEDGQYHHDFDADNHLQVARNLAGAQAAITAAHAICILRDLDPKEELYAVMCDLRDTSRLSEVERQIVLLCPNATWGAQQPLIYDEIKAPDLNNLKQRAVDRMAQQASDDIKLALILQWSAELGISVNGGYNRRARMNVFAELDEAEVQKDLDQVEAAATVFCNAITEELTNVPPSQEL